MGEGKTFSCALQRTPVNVESVSVERNTPEKSRGDMHAGSGVLTSCSFEIVTVSPEFCFSQINLLEFFQFSPASPTGICIFQSQIKYSVRKRYQLDQYFAKPVSFLKRRL